MVKKKGKKRQVTNRKATGKTGQPTKLTPTVQAILIEAIEIGAHYETACALAGITFQTFRNWQIRGEKAGKGVYFEFFESLTRAEAKNEVDRLAEWRAFMRDEVGIVEEVKVNKDGTQTTVSKERVIRHGDYRAVRDFLERRHRARWGNKVELGGLDGGPIEITEIKRVIVDA